MKCLLCAATLAELKPTMEHFGFKEVDFNSQQAGNLQLDILISGVGMVSTTYHLSKKLSLSDYDLVLNAGIAGAFDREIEIGEVVSVSSELFSEMGAEDGDNFLSLIKLGLQEPKEFPFLWGELVPMEYQNSEFNKLKKVRGITVNTVHGNMDSILKVQKMYNPQIESMEGAAVFYTSMMEKTNCIQIRSISNYVEKRNRENWNIPLAIKNLNDNLISQISVWAE